VEEQVNFMMLVLGQIKILVWWRCGFTSCSYCYGVSGGGLVCGEDYGWNCRKNKTEREKTLTPLPSLSPILLNPDLKLRLVV
jgi:hypothetical protein